MVEEVAEKYKDSVNIIGILVDVQGSDGAPDENQVLLARKLMDNAGAKFTNILMSRNILASVMKGVSATPTIFFVDDKGNRTGDVYMGGRSLSAWSGIIDEML